MNLGLVLGGAVKGATDTYDTLETNKRADTKATDEHTQALRLQQYQRDSDANAASGGASDGDAIGSATGDAQPLANWAADRGLDASVFPPGTTAAQASQHPLFQQITGAAPSVSTDSMDTPQVGGIPTAGGN